jgi:hypothetical protein
MWHTEIDINIKSALLVLDRQRWSNKEQGESGAYLIERDSDVLIW